MIIFIKCVAKYVLINSDGNLFSQGLKYCATLRNVHTCVAVGLETVDPNLKYDLGSCLSMARIKDGDDERKKIGIMEQYKKADGEETVYAK